MQNTTESDSRSPPHATGVITRAPTSPLHDTAQPSLTSGFGAVIEKEHDLRVATEDSFSHVSGPHSIEIDRILRHQHSRLSANIALLEQRYEALPNPDRLVNWRDRSPPPAKLRRIQRDGIELLPYLIAQHTCLRAEVEALSGRVPDGQRGELILSEVSRNHEEMAWMLTALIKEDETMAREERDNTSGATAGVMGRAQEDWDNEGGPVRITPLQ